jgi:transcription elongation GreA/GreB family factor
MDKSKIIGAIRLQLEKDLSILKEAALIAYEAATNEESKPENEYDTRALEASYIAGAQAKRAGDIEELLSLYKYIDVKKFTPTDPIASTALVKIEQHNKKLIVFVMSKGGGMNLKVEGQSVQVVTPSSPLGEALIGLKVDDTALVEVGGTTIEYDIISVE